MICPDCIEEMIPEIRKEPVNIFGHFAGFGNKKVFYVCPICGFNLLKNSADYDQIQQLEDFKENINRINNKNYNNEKNN